MDMHHEPFRLPALQWSAVAVIGAPAAAALFGVGTRKTIATAILGAVAAGAVIAGAESTRARTDSPATMERRMAETAAELDAMRR